MSPTVGRQPSHILERVPRVVNPFGLRPFAPGMCGHAGMALTAVSLFPIRLIVLIGAVLIAGALAVLATIGADGSKPLNAARRLLLHPIQWLARVALWCLGYWRIPVTRPDAVQGVKTPRVLVSAPHYSLIDVFFWTYYEMPMTLSHHGVASIPIVGRIARAMETIFVDRRTAEARAEAANTIKRRCLEPGWPRLLVFPEGTVTNGSALIQFRPGAFAVGEAVQPVILRYGTRPLDVSGAVRGYEVFLYAMLQPANSLSVEFLSPAVPSQAELSDPRLFAGNVRAAMAAALGVPCTNHSYEDAWLAAVAHEGGREVAQTFEVKSLAPLLQLDADGLVELLRRFHRLDSNGSGRLEYEEFVDALDLAGAAPGYARRLFRLFDTDESGSLSFAELTQGLAVLSPNCEPLDRLKLAFITCDLDAEGGVTLSSLRRVVAYAAERQRASTGRAPIDAERLEAAFAASDRDGDRALDFNEFCSLVEANAELLGIASEMARGRLEGSALSRFVEEAREMKEVRRSRSKQQMRSDKGGNGKAAAGGYMRLEGEEDGG